MAIRFAGNMYQVAFFSQGNDDIIHSKQLNITIDNANPHNFCCQFDQDCKSDDNDEGKTKLDIDLTKLDDSNGKYVLINIKISNNRIRFMPDSINSAGEFERFALTVGSPQAAQDIKHFGFKYPNGDGPVDMISFVCKRTDDGDGKKPHVFNIGLIVEDEEDGYFMPIFIDPKVENDGN